jgi:hypothetical protein
MVAEVVASISLFWGVLVVLVASLGYFQMYCFFQYVSSIVCYANELAVSAITRPSTLHPHLILRMVLLPVLILPMSPSYDQSKALIRDFTNV